MDWKNFGKDQNLKLFIKYSRKMTMNEQYF